MLSGVERGELTVRRWSSRGSFIHLVACAAWRCILDDAGSRTTGAVREENATGVMGERGMTCGLKEARLRVATVVELIYIFLTSTVHVT